MKTIIRTLVGLLTLGLLAAPASAHLKGWNVSNDYGALPRPGGQFYRDLDWAKQSHADILRVSIYEPQMQSARDVRWMTRYLRTIRRLGMRIDLLVWGDDATMKADPEAFAAACARAARLWAPYLAAIEVGNEPNVLLGSSMTRAQFERADAEAAAAYVPVARGSYQAVKRVAPRLTVLAGAIAFSDGVFLEDLYADGIGGYFDGLSVHPYTYNAPPGHTAAVWPEKMFSLKSGVPWLHRIMAERGDGQKKVWITEVGWNTVTDPGITHVNDGQRAGDVAQLGPITRRWRWLAAVMFYEMRYQGHTRDGPGWAFVSRSWQPSRSFWAFEHTAF